MIITIANNIIVESPTNEIIDYCKNKLTIDNPDYLTAKKVGRYCGNIERQLKLYTRNGDNLVLPFGTFKDIWKLSDIGTEIVNKIHVFKGNNLQGNIKLYDYQEKALKSLLKGKNGVLQAPCGSGKTQIGLQLIKEIGGKALWLTHTKKLVEQSKSRCKTYFTGDFGEITNGCVDIGKDITFATVQTMSKIDIELYKNEFDIVVVDECHHCIGSPTKVMQFYKIVSNCNARYKYGLSATLSRSDNLIGSLYSIIGPKLHTITSDEIGDKIIKAKEIRVDVKCDYDIKEYINFDGTLNFSKLIDMLSFCNTRNEIITSNVLNGYTLGKKQLVLCHRVKQVEILSQMISTFCKVSCITGKVKDISREYDADVIVATYSLAKEGLDIPDLDVLHLATPQKSESIVIQSIGRIERNIKGKATPEYYDYVDIKVPYCLSCYKKRRSIVSKNKKN